MGLESNPANDLKTLLLGRFNKDLFIESVKADEKKYQELLKFSLSNEIPLGWRAAWILRHVFRPQEPGLKAIIPHIIRDIQTFDESRKREWLKILSKLDIEEALEGELYDKSVEIWLNIHNHSALRISAMQCIVRFIKKYPELKEELDHITEPEYLEVLSPGIRKTFEKLTRDL